MLEKINLNNLISKVSLSSLVSYTATDIEHVYNFKLKGRKRNWNISLDFSNDFPNKFPLIKLLDISDIGSIAHVNSIGTVCINESDTILIDRNRLVEMLEYYLNDIKSTLDRCILKEYQDELMDEYEGYFYPNIKDSINSFYTTDIELEEVYIKVKQIKKNRNIFDNYKDYSYPVLILDKNKINTKDFSDIKNINSTIINAIHVPLSEKIMPPLNGQNFSLKYLQTIINNLNEQNKKKLLKILDKTKENNQFYILLSIPRSINLRTELLIEFSSINKSLHPLLNYSEEWIIDLYSINRHSKEYLLNRGGADSSLDTKVVTIVGCGSIGGEIAYMLAKAGIGNIILVDNDKIHPDNIYRHRVGGRVLSYIPDIKTGKVIQTTKVSALKYLLEKDLPHINVDIRPNKFEQVINDKDIEKSDMIIVAIGSPMPSLFINEELKNKKRKNIIFCWNEAANYGGHSVLLNLEKNCLQCLYTIEDNLGMSKISLIKPSKNITKNLTGCAGVFTPFSYLSSSQTALLASNQCIKALHGFNNSIASSWKGEGNQELECTERYNNMELIEEILLTRDKNCRVCNVK